MYRPLRLHILTALIFNMTPLQAFAAPVPLSDWMATIFAAYPHTTLDKIILPGTHNSATHSITENSAAGLNTPNIFGIYLWSLWPLRKWVASWAICQTHSITTQLKNGIRVLDLRVAKKGPHLIIEHGLISCTLLEVCTEIRAFAAAHPREVIIVSLKPSKEYQSSHGLSEVLSLQQEALLLMAESIEPFVNLHYDEKDTLSTIWTKKMPIIINPIMRSKWLQSTRPKHLKKAAKKFLLGTRKAGLSELKLALTPDARTILSHALTPIPGGLALASWQAKVLVKIKFWLRRWFNAGIKLNIVSCDFYEIAELVQVTTELNLKRIKAKDLSPSAKRSRRPASHRIKFFDPNPS